MPTSHQWRRWKKKIHLRKGRCATSPVATGKLLTGHWCFVWEIFTLGMKPSTLGIASAMKVCEYSIWRINKVVGNNVTFPLALWRFLRMTHTQKKNNINLLLNCAFPAENLFPMPFCHSLWLISRVFLLLSEFEKCAFRWMVILIKSLCPCSHAKVRPLTGTGMSRKEIARRSLR